MSECGSEYPLCMDKHQFWVQYCTTEHLKSGSRQPTLLEETLMMMMMCVFFVVFDINLYFLLYDHTASY